MGVLVMRFVDVKDLGEALSDTEHCLVYVNFSLMLEMNYVSTRQLS